MRLGTEDRRWYGRGCVAALMAALAWGAFAFGAVYPWAYSALLAAVVMSAVMGLIAGSNMEPAVPARGFRLALVAVGAVGMVQLLPLPVSLIRTVSPATDATLRQLRLPYAAGLDTFHPLSIAPAATLVGLVLFASFVALLLGLVRVFSIRGVSSVANGVVVIGVALAVFGIIQKPLYNGHIYGFWTPVSLEATPFGPFVNKNHFAGWMLMALPICLGTLLASIADGRRARRRTMRERCVWLGSEQGSRVLATGLAAAVMGLSLVMTMSRSGISAFALSLVLSGWLFARGFSNRVQKSLLVGYLVLLLGIAIGWAGTDVVAARFAALNAGELGLRTDAWADALRIARAFLWTGTGLNTYGTATLIHQTADPTHHFMEAHNDYLQLAAEGGLLTAVPIVLALGLFAREVANRAADAVDRPGWWIRRGAVTGLLAIAMQETVDFSLQMPGNAVLFTVLCAMAIHRAPRS